MKNIILIILLILLIHKNNAQVGIGIISPDTSSLLDINSTNKGVLIPRIALTAINSALPVTSPATSLLVYNEVTAGAGVNEVTPGYYYWDSSQWVRLTDGLPIKAENGLYLNAVNNAVRLGGGLLEDTTITSDNFRMNYNLTGFFAKFAVQENGVNHFVVNGSGNTFFGGDTFWRDENTSGTIIARLADDGNDGRFRIYENGVASIDLDANGTTAFNIQTFNRDFKISGTTRENLFFVDAGLNSVGINTNTPLSRFHVEGNVTVHGDSPRIHLSVDDESDAMIRFSDDDAPTTQKFEIAFNANDQDLHIRSDDNSGADIIRIHNEGNIEMDQGWLAVGANSASNIKRGVYEGTWRGNFHFDTNGYRYRNLGYFYYPLNGIPSSVRITKIMWEMDGHHTDPDEQHGVWVSVGSPWYGIRRTAVGGRKDVNWQYVSAAISQTKPRGTLIRMRVEDEDCGVCGNDEMRVYSMHYKI